MEHLAVIHLVVVTGSHNPTLDAGFHPHSPINKTGMIGKEHVTPKPIPDIVVKGPGARQLPHINLQPFEVVRQRRMTPGPALTVHHDAGVYLIKCHADLIYRRNIYQTHEVKAKAVDLILSSPVADRIDDELPHHGTFSGQLIAAAGAVAEVAPAILPVVVPWN